MRAIAIQSLVGRLLTYEAAESQNPESLIKGAERILDNLDTHLSQRIGKEGFRTLLARALTLTTAQFPHLSAVRVGADGSLVGLRGATGRIQGTGGNETPEDTVEGAVAVVAHLLGLLITFIGEDLTLRILSTVWPELAFDDATGGENERL